MNSEIAVSISLDEACRILRLHVQDIFGLKEEPKTCTFIAKYPDGSGEGDIRGMVVVDRIELEL